MDDRLNSERQIIVTAGPTISHAEVHSILPEARVKRPVGAGEILEWNLRAGDILLIIDGLFLQSRAVRHKEIMAMLNAGVTVLGSSSMGALRAAELSAFGMHGIGSVFRDYYGGRITADDEVALLHADEEADYRAVGWALVDLRMAVATAVESHILTASDAQLIVARTAAMPFTERRPDAVLTEASAAGIEAEKLAAFRALCRTRTHWAKHRDARTALKVAGRIMSLRRSPDTPPPAPAGLKDPRIFRDTSYLHAWRPVFQDPTGHHWSAHDLNAWAASACSEFPRIYQAIAGECLLLEALDKSPSVSVTDARAHIAEHFDLRGDSCGLLSWGDIVAALYPLLPRLGLQDLPGRVDDTLGQALLRPKERCNDPKEAATLLATRLWRGDPQYDWQTPTARRLLLLGICPPAPGQPLPDHSASLKRRVMGLLASWGCASSTLTADLRARGFLDIADLLRAGVRGALAQPGAQAVPRLDQSVRIASPSTV